MSAPLTITVLPTPVADFSTIDTFGCAPYHVQFTDNSTSGGVGATITGRTWFFVMEAYRMLQTLPIFLICPGIMQ